MSAFVGFMVSFAASLVEALTRFAQQIVGRSHARIPKIFDFVESTARTL